MYLEENSRLYFRLHIRRAEGVFGADEFLILDAFSDEVKDADKLYDKVENETDGFIETMNLKSCIQFQEELYHCGIKKGISIQKH